MTKLKCWRKERQGKNFVEYDKPNFRDFIIIKKIEVGFNQPKPLYRLITRRSRGKDFKSKSQALKFANSYMKKHNRC